VDDGLKNQKIHIIRQAYLDSTVLHTREFGINQFRILPSDSLRKTNVFSKQMIYMEYDDEMEPYRVLRTGFYAPDGRPYSLEIRTSTVEEDDFLIDLTIALVVLYLLIVFTLFLVNNFALERALKPLESLTKDLQNYKFGGSSRVKPVSSSVTEFIILDQKIQEMIDRNESLFLRQKQFIENASHELQTPLAITINKLDLLLENGDLIRIPRKDGLVLVSGEVLFPNAVAYENSLSLKDYIDRAGGFTQLADNARVVVAHRDGAFEQVDMGRIFANATIKAGDQILVLPKVDQKKRQFWKDMTQILFQIAVSAKVALGL